MVSIAKWQIRLNLTLVSLPNPITLLCENLQDTAMSEMNSLQRVLPVLTLCRMWCCKFAPTLAECYSGLSARLQGSDVQSASSAAAKLREKNLAPTHLWKAPSALWLGQKVENLLSRGDQSCMQVSALGRHLKKKKKKNLSGIARITFIRPHLLALFQTCFTPMYRTLYR